MKFRIAFASIMVGLAALYLYVQQATPVSDEPASPHNVNAQAIAESPDKPLATEPSSIPATSTSETAQAHTKHTLVTKEGKPFEWSLKTPAALRAQTVELNRDLFTPAPSIHVGDTLEVDIFGEKLASTVHRVDTWGNGTVAISTTLPENPHSHIYLSYTGDVARALIQDRTHDRTYMIRHNTATNEHVLLEVDYATSDIRHCGTDELDHSKHTHADEAHADEAHDDPTPINEAESTAAAPTTAATFDLLAVYSPAAVTIEGSVANVQNNISIAVQTANTILTNSQVYAQVNLVHTEQVTYTEVNPSADLDALTDTDGVIDNVHTLRNTHNADFVSFFISTSTGGLGWVPDHYHEDRLSYNIVRIQQTSLTPTLIHEMGHNMGNGHSASQVSGAGPGDIYPFAAGWQWADGSVSGASIGYCTVMTYENFDNNAGNGDEYKRIDYFSNPSLTYNGNAIGHATQGDVARVIRSGRFELASQRGTAVIPSDTISTFPYNNSFESNLDYFYQASDDTYFWRGTQTGNTFQNPTGPTSGAQDGSYYAVVIGYDNASFYNQTASMIAPVNFTNKTNAALSFYYHMYDGIYSHMGSLHVDVSTNGGSSWVSDVWSISGDQNDQWHLANVDLSAYNGQNILIRFRAVTGSNFLTDICLDNVTITANDATPTYATWVANNYGGLSDSTENGDPDGDGISNFTEYAFGMAPNTASTTGLPTLAHDTANSQLEITFKREQAGVQYIVESSTNLSTWSTVWDSNTSPANLVSVGANQTVEVNQGANTKLFLRVRLVE